jgi:hypothetical protein
MFLQIWRFVTLLAAALGLAMGAAHALELPQKMAYDLSLYTTVNTTMYRYFAIAGAVITIGGIVSAAVLAYFSRGRTSFRWILAGTLGLVLSFALWLAIVAPVNAQAAAAMAQAPGVIADVWARERGRWEWGHVAAFAAWLMGFALLLGGTLREIPVEERAGEPIGSREPVSRTRAWS